MFKPVYGALKESSNTGAPQIALFNLRSISSYEEARNGGFLFRKMDVLRLSHNLT